MRMQENTNQMADVSAHWGMRNRVHRVVIILKEIICFLMLIIHIFDIGFN